MADEVNKSKSHDEEAKLRFSPEQYEMLLRCSKEKNMTEWNNWRRDHPKEDILLEEANFYKRWLQGAFLAQVAYIHITPKKKTITESGKVYLAGANFKAADLTGADFRDAHLENARFNLAILEKANFRDAYVRGTIFYKGRVGCANMDRVIVDNETSFWEVEVDSKTNLVGVPLESLRIDPGTKQLLEYNIRRMNWEQWYKKHRLLRWPVRCFWLLSDYGLSTWRVII